MASQMDCRSNNTRVWFASRYEHLDSTSASGGNRGCLAIIAAVLATLSGFGLVAWAATGGFQ